MAGASDATENGLLLLIFQNSNYANVGDATGLRGSTTAGSFFISAHTADPTDAAATGQTTNETSYTNYARQTVARSSGGWTVSGTTQVANAAIISFPACGATGATLTHYGIGSASSGNGNLNFLGALTSSLAVSSGITPSFAIGALVITLD